ncbi:MAG: response regulator [Magnetococcales bacterium]|nr:response regulator [Magnetococcales bacterium]
MKLKTLIIDDHPASIAILKNMLADVCECFVATRGQRGIELFEQSQSSGKPFEVILLDIIMPGLDGIETLKQIRKLERDSPTAQQTAPVRIIMQTSSEDPDDYNASHLEGKCSGFINKPYSRDAIMAIVLGKDDPQTAGPS